MESVERMAAAIPTEAADALSAIQRSGYPDPQLVRVERQRWRPWPLEPRYFREEKAAWCIGRFRVGDGPGQAYWLLSNGEIAQGAAGAQPPVSVHVMRDFRREYSEARQGFASDSKVSEGRIGVIHAGLIELRSRYS